MTNKRQLYSIFLIVFIDLMGFGIILPMLPYIAEQFHANAFHIGLLIATYSLFQFIASPLLGRLSDRYGRKKILIISQLGSMVGFIILGLARSLPLLFASRLIDGITGGNISIAQAYVADITDKTNRAQGMGVLGAAFGLGFILGPAIGGILSQYGFAIPAFFAAGVSLITVIATNLFLTETVDTAKASHSPKTRITWQKLQTVMTTHPIGLLIVVFFLINLAFSGLQGTYALWTERTFGWGPTQNGYIFAYIGILSVITQLKVLPLFVKKFGERKTLAFSIPSMMAGFLVIAFSPTWHIMLIGNAFFVLGNALANPTIQAIASENVDPAEYGGTLGILQSSASMGRIFGPIIGGELFYAINKNAPYVSSALILLPTFFLILTKLPRTKRRLLGKPKLSL